MQALLTRKMGAELMRRAMWVGLVLAMAGLFAPTDLVRQRGGVLRGLIGSYCNLYRCHKSAKIKDSGRTQACTASQVDPLSADQNFEVPVTSWAYKGATFGFGLTYHSSADVDSTAAGLPFFCGLSESTLLHGPTGMGAGNVRWTHTFCQWVDLDQDEAGVRYAVWHRGDGTKLSFPFNPTSQVFTSPDSYHSMSYGTATGGVYSPCYDSNGVQAQSSITYASFTVFDGDATEYDFNTNASPSNTNPPGNSKQSGCPTPAPDTSQPYLFWATSEQSAIPHYLLTRIRDRWSRTLYVNWQGLTGKMGEVEPRVVSVTNNASPATTFLTFTYNTDFTLASGQETPLLTGVTDQQGRTHTFNYSAVPDETGANRPKLTALTVYGPGAGPCNCNRTVLPWSFAYSDANNQPGGTSPNYGGVVNGVNGYTGDLIISKSEPDGNVRHYTYRFVDPTVTGRQSEAPLVGDANWDGVLQDACWSDSSEGPAQTIQVSLSVLDV